jgi:hypothetical protein
VVAVGIFVQHFLSIVQSDEKFSRKIPLEFERNFAIFALFRGHTPTASVAKSADAQDLKSWVS